MDQSGVEEEESRHHQLVGHGDVGRRRFSRGEAGEAAVGDAAEQETEEEAEASEAERAV